VPFNARVQENYYSLAFFLAYEAPWNIYHRSPAVLERLVLTLRYALNLMGEDGAIPELDDVPSSALAADRMVAAGGFGVEHLAGTLESAGGQLPTDIRDQMIARTRQAALLVLTSEPHLAHAEHVTNQYTGALVGAMKLSRLTRDQDLKELAASSSEHLWTDFLSGPGYLYEADGADTFGYFLHTTLDRLIALYHEWPHPQIPEVLRRHCAWMSRWLLPDPQGDGLVQSTAHLTRTCPGYPVSPLRLRGTGRLLGSLQPFDGEADRPRALQDDGGDERRILKLILETEEAEASRRLRWESDPDPVASCRRRCMREGYRPAIPRVHHETHTASQSERSDARAMLPCLDRSPRVECLQDGRGNQFIFARQPSYYIAFSYADQHRGQARYGPSFLWLDGGGTAILSENGDRHCWETLPDGATKGTGKMSSRAEISEGQHEVGVTVPYPELGVKKIYALRERNIHVGLYDITGTWRDKLLVESIPLLMCEGDDIDVGYGRWRNCMGGKLCCYTDQVVLSRQNRALLRIALQAKAQVWFRATFDDNGFIRTRMTFALTPGFYSKYGYRIDINPE